MDNLPDRIAQKIHFEPETGCWLWTAHCDPRGYGRVHTSHPRKNGQLAHRVVYTLLVGPIPDGLYLDHRCRVHHCVNPDHLHPVTPRQNALENSLAPSATNATATHCAHGHPFTETNTYRRPHGEGRDCRACIRTRVRAYAQRRGGSA